MSHPMRRPTEVILLVEGEDMVRGLARMILETSGYVVLEARNGREGLTMCETNEGPSICFCLMWSCPG
jgi:CheY-like chemotaxis protein